MKQGEALLAAAQQVQNASLSNIQSITSFSRHEALLKIRRLLVEEPWMLVLDIDEMLAENESQLDPATYDHFRRQGYLFPGDFDNVSELMKLRPKEPQDDGDDGLLRDFGEVE